MRQNRSPWLYQLDQARLPHKLNADLDTDVVIVGAGIAGIATAFFALKYTDKRVVVLEKFRLAHGATGHNAGQVVSYFEHGFVALVKEFGQELAAQGQLAIDSAWELIDEMYTDSLLDIPFSRFLGHAGLSSYAQVLFHIQNNAAKKAVGVPLEKVSVAKEALFLHEIPQDYAELYEVVPQKKILQSLETEKKEYIGMLSSQKGVINSALFCEKVFLYLQRVYGERFALYEHANVHKVLLRRGHAVLDIGEHTVDAKRVVLCTNGFKDLHIINEGGLEVDGHFHMSVDSWVGYMSGYLEKFNKPPAAISYFPEPDQGADPVYFYMTRREYEFERGTKHNLISMGGPEAPLQDGKLYAFEEEYPEEAGEEIDAFIRKTYDTDPNKNIDYLFTWHGLMGYTKNGVRMIGPEPQNPVLLYNLGCNGVGILPSVYGGRTIARHLNGEQIPPSIFDIPRATL